MNKIHRVVIDDHKRWEEPDLPTPKDWGASHDLRPGVKRHFPVWTYERNRLRTERAIAVACCWILVALLGFAWVTQ